MQASIVGGIDRPNDRSPSERSPKRKSTTSIPLVPIRRERRPLCHHPNDPESSGWATDPIAIKDASLEAELNDKALR
ncbi:MAG: hypothetical protein CBD47_02855 [Synechococcus sp. TMED187]|nr:hypothetical protein [Synechococcus sp. NAT40]OUW48506.1 MAG: hypothetical protein CBD47_02855 [Synechococcus sp. TMED187]